MITRTLIATAAIATIAALATLTASITATPAHAQSYGHLDPITPSQKTRAEVLADLVIYRESGLALVDRVEDYWMNSAQRAEAEQRYAALKASPRYAELVRQFAEQQQAKGRADEGLAGR